MTSFVVRDATHLGADRIATSTTAFALYENLKAALEGDSAAIAAGFVLANNYIKQAMIHTSQGSVSLSGSPQSANITLPGGEYGFYPQVTTSNTGIGRTMSVQIALQIDSTLQTVVHLTVAHSGGDAFGQVRQRYVTASPPYDLGDGAVPLFVFVLVDSLGKVVATYVAEDPPWAYNGPTKIVPDFIGADGKPYINRMVNGQVNAVEVTQEIKQADMALIPHPFMNNDLTGKTVVMLDARNSNLEKFRELNRAGESIPALITKGDIIVDNVPLSRVAPRGVVPVSVRVR